MKFLEKSVAIERGKGVKSKSVITIIEVRTHVISAVHVLGETIHFLYIEDLITF